jgi:hypothetical protein
MLRPRLVGCLVALASVGWLVPMWLGVNSYLRFWQAEGYPLSLQGEHPLNSFPFLHFASECFAVAFAWLGAVGLGWSYALSVWLVGVLRPNNSFKPKPLRGSA